jgi:hypothetical protein
MPSKGHKGEALLSSSGVDNLRDALDQATKPHLTSSVATWLYDGGEAYYQQAVCALSRLSIRVYQILIVYLKI